MMNVQSSGSHTIFMLQLCGSIEDGSKHVPFCNSKLMYLLQDCLSKDGKALMFVNLSITPESSNKSLCSL
jgi:kinesin family protein C1